MHTVLNTDRLTLRPLDVTDAPDFARLVNNIDICRMTSTFPYPFPTRSVEGLVDIFCARAETGHSHHWAIIWQGQFVGVIGLFGKPEARDIGYWLGEPFWGQGLMKEAVAGLMDHLVTRNPQVRIAAGVFTDNPASAHLLKCLGFQQMPDLGRGYSIARDGSHDLWEFEFHADNTSCATQGVKDTEVQPHV